MGGCFSFEQKSNNIAQIKIIDNIQKGKRFDYLRPRREIILTMDRVYNVPMLNINFEDWYVISVRLCPKSEKARHCFQCWLERTPPDTRSSNISCCSNSSASFDTVH